MRKTADEFWNGWNELLDDERFAEVEESPGLARAWRAVTAPLRRGQVAETDVYLAAFALAGSHRIVSFDRCMKRFPGVEADLLS